MNWREFIERFSKESDSQMNTDAVQTFDQKQSSYKTKEPSYSPGQYFDEKQLPTDPSSIPAATATTCKTETSVGRVSFDKSVETL